MKPPFRRCALASIAILCLSAAGLLSYNAWRVGKTFDSYRGVPVYDNGLLHGPQPDDLIVLTDTKHWLVAGFRLRASL